MVMACCCVTPENEISVTGDLQNFPRTARVFAVNLEKSECLRSAVGLQLDLTDGKGLVVVLVEDGIAQDYNSVADDRYQIQPFDRIIKANGQQGDAQALLDEVRSASSLNLVLERPHAFHVNCRKNGPTLGLEVTFSAEATTLLVVRTNSAKVGEEEVGDVCEVDNNMAETKLIRPGDRIFEVNGVSGPAECLFELIKAHSKLKMLLLRYLHREM